MQKGNHTNREEPYKCPNWVQLIFHDVLVSRSAKINLYSDLNKKAK